MEAQRSGFHWERTSDGMSEPCPLGRGEGYEVREDEVGRFKGMGYLGEGGNRNPPSPRQLFGNFLSAQKVTRPGAKYPFYVQFSNRIRRAATGRPYGAFLSDTRLGRSLRPTK